MSLRCGCENEADDIVFGPLHRCGEEVKPVAPPRLIPSWAFVVPEHRYETTLAEDETHDR